MSLPDSLTHALETYAGRGRVLVATDFDGVLAPFVDDPVDARPLEGALDALEELQAGGAAVAIVSGRHLDALQQVTGVGADSAITLIGSHGGESSRPLDLGAPMDDAARERLAATTAALERIAADHPGVRVEHKPAGVVLHTRGVAADLADAASETALQVPDQVGSVHAMRGKDVVELSMLEVSKGIALQALSQAVEAEAVLYLGDDVTDETAFALLPADDGHVTIKVGPGETVATYRVDSPEGAVAVLRTLARLRTG